MFIYCYKLPWSQFCPSTFNVPLVHEHVAVPLLFEHVWVHPPFAVSHMSTAKFYIMVYIYKVCSFDYKFYLNYCVVMYTTHTFYHIMVNSFAKGRTTSYVLTSFNVENRAMCRCFYFYTDVTQKKLSAFSCKIIEHGAWWITTALTCSLIQSWISLDTIWWTKRVCYYVIAITYKQIKDRNVMYTNDLKVYNWFLTNFIPN